MDPITLALLNRKRRAAVPAGRPPATRPAAGRPAVAAAAAAPPTAPNFAALLAELSRGPATRSQEEWDALLNPRIKPYVDAIENSTLRGRAFNEYNYETKAAANKGLSSAFLGILTGGKTGAEAEQFSKENFGGSYLGGQALQLAGERLTTLTADFDQNDWKLTSDYLEAMREVPAIREELRATLEKQDLDQHARRVTEATLLVDESWRYYQANRAEFEYGQGRSDKLTAEARDRADAKALQQEQLRIAREAYRRQMGQIGYEKRSEALSEAREFAKQTGNRWAVRRAKDGSYEPYDTGKPLPKKPGSSSTVGLRNSALREASDMTKGTGSIWRVRKEGGQWIAYDTGQPVKKDPDAKATGLSEAMKAERDLAVSILTDHRESILGKPSAAGFAGERMDYAEAYDFVYNLAEATLAPYGRRPAYLGTWTKNRLKALGLNPPAGKRSGR